MQALNNKGKSKAQSSVEFLMVIGIATILILPGIYLFLNNAQGSKAQAVSSQVYLAGNQMLRSGTELYVLGDESWLTIELSLPEEVTEVNLSNSGEDLVIKYGTTQGISDMVFFAQGYSFQAGINRSLQLCENCTLRFPRGRADLRMQSLGDGTIWLKVDHP